MANDLSKLVVGNTTYDIKDATAARKGMYVGTCPSSASIGGSTVTMASSPDKVVTVDTFPTDANDKPLVGTIIGVKYATTNTYKTDLDNNKPEAPHRINVNNTGFIQIYYNNAALKSGTSANSLAAGYKNRYIFYQYDGTYWVWLSAGTDTNTTYSGYSFGLGLGVQNNASASATITVTLTNYALATGGVTAVRFLYDVPASATMNINSKGAKSIYYKNSAITAGIIKAGDTATFVYSGQYHLISIDRWDTDIKAKANSADLAAVATSGSYNDLSDKPTIPSTSGLATETYVQNQISGLVNSAPAALDTLNELAAALGNDANFSTTVTNAIASKRDKPIGFLGWGETYFNDWQDFPRDEANARELTSSEAAAIQDIHQNAWNREWCFEVGSYPMTYSWNGEDANIWTVLLASGDTVAVMSWVLHYNSNNEYWFTQHQSTIATTDIFATVATSGSYNDLTNKPTLLTTQKTILYASGTTQNLSFTNSSNASLVRDQVVDLLNNVGNDILLFLTNPIDSVTYPYIFTEKVSDTRWKLQLLSDTKYGHVTLDSGRGNNIVAWENVLNTIPTVDSSLTGSSQTNPVQGGAIYSALAEKMQRVVINMEENNGALTFTDVDGNALTHAQVRAILNDTNNHIILCYDDHRYTYDENYSEEDYWEFKILALDRERYVCIYWNENSISCEEIYTESLDVNYVPSIRKINNKPLSSDITLTASDVGALPSNTTIPTKVSDLTNDSGFTTNVGTVTGVKMNNGSAISPTNGVVDLGTVITSHQSLSGYAKYVLCQDETAYNDIQNKDSGTLYLIPES